MKRQMKNWGNNCNMHDSKELISKICKEPLQVNNEIVIP